MGPRLIGTNSQWELPAGQEFGNRAVKLWQSDRLKHLHCVIMSVSRRQSCAGGPPAGTGSTFRSPGVFSLSRGERPRC